MKITNRFKKLFALFFVLAVVIPLTSSFGVWDMLTDTEDTYATGNDVVADGAVTEGVVADDVTTGGTVDTSSVEYKFSMGIDEDIYNYDAEFTFDGVSYKGVFSNEIKATSDNTKLKVGDLGTLENPYVVLEITPVASVSELRPHVADMGYFDMTQEEVDAIVLTEGEKNVVRMQALYQLTQDAAVQEKKEELEHKIREIQQIVTIQYAAEIQEEYKKRGYEYWQPDDVKAAVLDMFCAIHDANYPTYKAMVEALNIKDTVNNRPADEDVTVTLNNIETSLITSGFITQEEYDTYINMKYDYALEYKKDYYKSVTYNRLLTNNNYRYNLEYVTQYEVGADGNFAIYSDGDTKAVTTTSARETYAAIANEVKMTNDMVNPLFLSSQLIKGNLNNKILQHSNTFTKGCLDVAFNTVLGESGRVESQTPYIDEYIFAGWSVMVDGEMRNINTLPDEYNLSENGITELYTNWVVRYYEKDTYEVLTTSGYVSVTFSSEDSTYTVMLPDCIASKQEGFHDFKNQLSICLAKQSKFLQSNQSDNTLFRGLYETEVISYVDEYSAWDFNFSIDKYSTVADLKKVAPKLMADTDYYVLTKNVEYDPATGVVTYYPYNVLVITATPEELNKMVYYDEVYRNKDASVGYQQSAYLNKFLDAVDFVYFSNGGQAVEYGGGSYGKATLFDTTFYQQVTINREPIKNRNPLLYTINADGSVTYDETKVITSGTYEGEYDDMEWQVAEKIYQRVAEPKDFAQSGKGQSRSMVVIFNEALGDTISSKAGAPNALVDTDGNYIAGSEDNLCKLMLMFFVYKDPTVLYQKYVDADYVENMNGIDINFDKIKGIVRTVGGDGSGDVVKYKNSSFTGVLYGYEKWNQSLFFPFEYFDPTFSTAFHVSAMVQGNGDENASFMYDPYEESRFPNAIKFWRSFGLAWNTVFKNVANPFAYTFNGDTAMAGTFYTYNIPEISNPTNGKESNGNSDLAFEYFRRVKPWEIKNGMIATKSAIEFMVQNANNSSLVTNKSITILNKAEERTRFNYTNAAGNPYTVYVDTVIVDDFTAAAANIEYKYTNTDEGFFVPEILWTKQFSQIDNNYMSGLTWYNINTLKEDTDDLKWYIMPDALGNANKNNYYITYNIGYSESTDSNGNAVTTRELTRTKALYSYEQNGQTVHTDDAAIIPGNEYYVEALLKPIIADETYDQRTYMVAVKQYDDYQAFLDKKEPENIVIRNVTMEKLTYLFNLD